MKNYLTKSLSVLLLLPWSFAVAGDSLERKLHSALYQQDIPAMTELLDRHPQLADVRIGATGATPLIYAAAKNNHALARLILKYTKAVNAYDALGYTAVQYAILREGVEMVKLLLVKADVNVPDRGGDSSLSHIIHSTRASSILQLLSKGQVDTRNPANKQAFIEAVDMGDPHVVKHFLELGFDPNTKSSNSFGFCIHRAIVKAETVESEKRRKMLVESLLAAGANPNSRAEHSTTPLHLAAASDATEIIAFLLSKGADPLLKDTNGIYPCFLSFSINDFHLLAKGVPQDTRDNNGLTILHYQTMYNNLELVKHLLAQKSDPNAQDRWGNTPAHYAVSAMPPHIKCLEALLAAGGNANANNKAGLSLLFIASTFGEPTQTKTILKKAGATLTRKDQVLAGLYNGVATKDYMKCREALAADKSIVNAVFDRWGKTPLIYAIEREGPLLVKLLLDHGADVNKADRDGLTPIMYAAIEGDTDIARQLLTAGADVNHKLPKRNDYTKHRIKEGYTALHLCTLAGERRGNPYSTVDEADMLDLVTLLLQQNAAIVSAADGKTPLHYVDEPKVLAAYIPHLTSELINARDARGNTPLHIAAQKGNYLIALMLIRAGADRSIRNNSGQTGLAAFSQKCGDQNLPFHHWLIEKARTNKQLVPIIVQLMRKGRFQTQERDAHGNTTIHRIIQLGLKQLLAPLKDTKYVNVQNDNGNTPLHLAASWGLLDVVQTLLSMKAKTNIKNAFELLPVDLARERMRETTIDGRKPKYQRIIKLLE